VDTATLSQRYFPTADPPRTAAALSPDELTQRYFPSTDPPRTAAALSPDELTQRYFPSTDPPRTAAALSPDELTQRYFPAPAHAVAATSPTQTTADWQGRIRAEAVKQGVDPALALAVAHQESEFNPHAVGGHGHSLGFFQLQRGAAGSSKHESGTAFDIVPLNAQGQPDWGSKHWDRLGALGKELGLTWGGDFTSLKDRPHFELAPAELSPEALSQRYFPAGK
jgi:hypothetical protein